MSEGDGGSGAPIVRWSVLRPGGIGAHVMLALALVMLVVGTFAWLERARMLSIERRLLALYDERVLPLRDLKSLSDLYAVRAVDTVHKVVARAMTAEQGVSVLRATLADADQLYARVRLRGPTVVAGADPLVRDARACIDEAIAMALANDVDGLGRWRQDHLYARIDPLTAHLEREVERQVKAVDSLVRRTHDELRYQRSESATVLGLSLLLAVGLGFWMTRSVLNRLQRVHDVVEKAAAGDLSVRVRLPGADELDFMGRGIDRMIESVARAKTRLLSQTEKLRVSERAAQEASQAKSLFLSSMSHELRTPLNVILGHAQILRRERSDNASVRLGVDRIEEAGTHLLSLIDDVLSLSRLESRGVDLRTDPYSPQDLLDEVVRMLSVPAAAKSLYVRARVDGTLPATLLGDRRRLAQVLLNLGGNAVKFTHEGGVEFVMGWRDQTLHVSVQDTGPGIAPTEQVALFDTFQQGASGHASAQGSGLGLYISRKLARAMGGDITLQSELGRGARFDVAVVAPVSDLAVNARVHGGAWRVASTSGLGPHLVIDDRATNREVLCALLRASGFETEEAANGEQALSLLASRAYAMVWVDIRMPGMDGFELVRRFRELSQSRNDTHHPHTPVVAITASVLELSEALAIEAGFDALAPKPFRDDALLQIMARLLPITLVPIDVEPSVRSRPSDLESVIAALSPAQCTELSHLLTLGDHAEAVVLLRRSPTDATERVVRQIEQFDIDALVDALRLRQTSAVEHKARTV